MHKNPCEACHCAGFKCIFQNHCTSRKQYMAELSEREFIGYMQDFTTKKLRRICQGGR